MAEAMDVTGLLCIFGPIVLISLPFVVFGIVWMVVGPFMFLYGVLFSERNTRKRMEHM